MSTVTEVIFKLLKAQDITAKEAARATGIAQSSFTDWKKGRSNPSYGAIVKLADFFGVSVDYIEGKSDNTDFVPKPKYSDEALKIASWWDQLDEISQAIIKGDILRRLESGPAVVTDTEEPVAAVVPIKRPAGRGARSAENQRAPLYLPVAGRSAAGIPIEMVDANDDPVAVDGETPARPGDFVVIAVGESMIDTGIRDGARCIIRPQPVVENGQIALVAVGDGSTIKRFYVDEDGVRLVPCNPAHDTQYYPRNAPIRIIGRVISVLD